MERFPALLMRKLRISKAKSTSLPREQPIIGLFSRLPFEIRYMIYVYALGGNQLNLSSPAILEKIGYPTTQYYQLSENTHHFPYYKFSLLKTCRQIYNEATPVFYSTNTFGIFGAGNLLVLCEFLRKTRIDHLASINSFYINCQSVSNDTGFPQLWKEAWELIVTQMPGLKDLQLCLIKSHFPPLKLDFEEEWVKPMLKVRGLKNFGFDLAQEIGSQESTADYNEKLERFIDKLQEVMCSAR